MTKMYLNLFVHFLFQVPHQIQQFISISTVRTKIEVQLGSKVDGDGPKGFSVVLFLYFTWLSHKINSCVPVQLAH